MRTAIVTGANGFIGARIVMDLLRAGCRVHALGRSTRDATWSRRVFAALDDIDGEPVDREHFDGLQLHEVDLLSPGLGHGGSWSDRIHATAETDAVLIHVAGDTGFAPADPALQRRINVDGTLNVARALSGCLARIVHVSTAYVCGVREGVILEDELDRGQDFRNPYERSKFEAERELTTLCRATGVPLVIVRPSIIINDTRTGRSSTFTHLNAFVEVVHRLQEYYQLGDGEVVSRSIRLLSDPQCRPNLAPVDPVVSALLAIADDPRAEGRTFHLAHPEPRSNGEIIDLLSAAFAVDGKLDIAFVGQLTGELTRTERMISRALKVYAPYLSSRARLDLRNTRSLIADYDAAFPALDLDYVQLVIAFQRSTRRG